MMLLTGVNVMRNLEHRCQQTSCQGLTDGRLRSLTTAVRSPPVSRLLGIAVNYTHTYHVAHMTEPHVNMSGDYNVCQGDSIVV